MRIAFQMDPITGVDINADSSFRIAEEAQDRGHELFFYAPDKLAYEEGRVTARGHKFVVQRVEGDPAILEPEEHVDLADMDVIWLRQDPPFDMHYITTTHLLDRLKGQALVVNDPFWVRNFPEKLLVLNFPDLTPPTTVARDLDTIRAFKERHGDVILKPLYGNGGAGVFRLMADDKNLSSLHELFTGFSREPLIVQKYLPDVTKGDKRVILVDGEPIGAINRVPAAGEVRSNMHVGGRPEKVALTARDLEICKAIGPVLRDNGQVFVGIDVIGDYLTEINVTSPTGLQELERFDGTNGAGLIWDAIEKEAVMSWQLGLLNPYLRLVEKRAMRNASSPEALRRSFRVKSKLFFHGPMSTTLRREEVAGYQALWVTPKAAVEGPVILYFHGGGYVFGAPETHGAMLGILAKRTGLRAVLPQYPLAPENPHPAAIDCALASYRALIDAGEEVVIGGDSAGGGIALALLGEITAHGLPQPKGTFAFSPLTDLTFSGESRAANAESDVVLPAERAEEMAQQLLGDQARSDPRVSPLFAKFKGASPVWLTVGDTEILMSDSLRMADALREQGVEVSLDLRPDHPHVWPLFHNILPEARRTLRELAGWITSLSRRPDGS